MSLGSSIPSPTLSLAFITSFSCLIALVKIANPVLSRSGDRPLQRPLGFRSNALTPYPIMLVIELLNIAFIVLKFVLSIASFFRTFYHSSKGNLLLKFKHGMRKGEMQGKKRGGCVSP